MICPDCPIYPACLKAGCRFPEACEELIERNDQ